MMMMGWHVLGACGVTVHKRGYVTPFGINPKLFNQKKLWMSPIPLDPLECLLNVGRGRVHHKGEDKYSKAIRRGRGVLRIGPCHSVYFLEG